MKPTAITIPVTLRLDLPAADLADLARYIVTRLTDEGALDEAAELGHATMAVGAAVQWAGERIAPPAEPVVAQEAVTLELPSGDTVRFDATDTVADLLATATEGRRTS